MVVITLKLDKYNYNIIWDKSTFTLLDIYMNLVEKGITLKQLDCINFIYNDSIITNHLTDYDTYDNDIIILLYVDDDIIIQDFIKHTQSSYDVDESISKGTSEGTCNDIHISEDIDESISEGIDESISEDIIKDINVETLKLFQEPDFKELLRIIITKPHLLNKVSSYITNGDISSDIDIIDSTEYNTEYMHIIELLNSINIIGMDKHCMIIRSVIKHFSGHINLSLRYILANLDNF